MGGPKLARKEQFWLPKLVRGTAFGGGPIFSLQVTRVMEMAATWVASIKNMSSVVFIYVYSYIVISLFNC